MNMKTIVYAYPNPISKRWAYDKSKYVNDYMLCICCRAKRLLEYTLS